MMQAPRRHLLPPNATPLERAIDQTFPQWDGLAEAMQPAVIATHPAWLASAAADWQLGQFVGYFDTVQALLAAGIPWRMRRGNPASVRQALGWLGYSTVNIEQDGYLLHIDPGRLVADHELLHIARVVRASLPLHVRFYRLYHGLDARALRYDGATRYDGALYDNDRGTMVELPDGEDPIKVSQWEGHATGSAALPSAPITALCRGWRHTVVAAADAMAYDAWAYDGEIAQTVSLGSAGTCTIVAPVAQRGMPIAITTEIHVAAADAFAPQPQAFALADRSTTTPIPLDNSRTWTGTWDSATWAVVFQTITERLH